MPKTLRTKSDGIISIPQITPKEIKYCENKSTTYKFSDGTIKNPGCINCIPQFCRQINRLDVTCKTFLGMSHDMDFSLCPVDAISAGNESISINETKCIGCGICAARCPMGAIYIKDGKATLSAGNVETQKRKASTNSIEAQRKYVLSIANIKREGTIITETESNLKMLYERIRRLNQEQQNILARNLLIALGNHATLSRHGNVYLRMDGFYENNSVCGVMEIETGADMLDVSRALLDDIATVNVRYNIPVNKNKPLAVCLELPNKRTDYWQVVQDIKNVTDIRINTITFGALLILLWNNKVVRDFSGFYIDIDNQSIREETSRILGRRINIAEGFKGILEISK